VRKKWKKWKMMLSLNAQFNGSAIKMLFLAMKRLLAQAIYNERVAVLGSDAVGYFTVTNCLRQRHFPSTLRESPDESLHEIHWDFP
jgi:hypothetical protein